MRHASSKESKRTKKHHQSTIKSLNIRRARCNISTQSMQSSDGFQRNHSYNYKNSSTIQTIAKPRAGAALFKNNALQAKTT